MLLIVTPLLLAAIVYASPNSNATTPTSSSSSMFPASDAKIRPTSTSSSISSDSNANIESKSSSSISSDSDVVTKSTSSSHSTVLDANAIIRPTSSSSSVSSDLSATTTSTSSSSSTVLDANAMIRPISSSSSVSSDLNATITPTSSSSSISSSTSSNFSTITASPYYDSAAFLNPYFDVVINHLSDEELSLAESCSTDWNNAFADWQKTAEVTTGPIIPATTYETLVLPWVSAITEASETLLTTIAPETRTVVSAGQGPLYYAADSFEYSGSEPCCFNCTMYGGSVQVFYWPTTAQHHQLSTAPALANVSSSTLVDEHGFSFVSPSVYVAFESLHAANLCGEVGKKITSTTLAFAPGELSTSTGWHVFSSLPFPVLLTQYELLWTQATFGDVTDCGNHVSTGWNVGGLGFYSYEPALAEASSIREVYSLRDYAISDLLHSVIWTYDPCKPTLSIPQQILSVNPQWKSCMSPATAFFDPPYVLTPGAGLSVFGSATESPTPGPSPQPATASKTVEGVLSPANPTATLSMEALKETLSADPGVPNALPSSAANKVVPSSHSIVLQSVQIISVADPSSPLQPSGPSDITETSGENSLQQAPTLTKSTTDPAASDSSLDDSSQPIPSPNTVTQSSPPKVVLSFGSSTFTAEQSSAFVFASHTLTLGGQVTISGTSLSLASNGQFAVIGTNTQLLVPTKETPAAVLQFGTSVITADSAVNFVIESHTLAPGGQLTVSDTTVSLASDGSFAVFDGTSTQSIVATNAPAAVLNFGSSTITVDASSNLVIDSHTLSPGSEVVVSGTSISLASNGEFAVVDGTTTQLMATPTQADATPVIGYAIGSQTLRPNGPAITIDGTAVSLLPGGSSVLVGTSTIAVSELSPATSKPSSIGGKNSTVSLSTLSSTTSKANIANVIMSLGGYTTATSAPSGVVSMDGTPSSQPIRTGEATSPIARLSSLVVALILAAVLLLSN